jgi:hypothetical protein
MSPVWIIVILVVVGVFALAAVSDFRRRRVRELDEKSSAPGYATKHRRDAQYRADKLGGPGH